MKASIILLALSSSLAQAGTFDSGGGTAVVCREPDGQIKSVELLDLFEGKDRYDYEIPVHKNISHGEQIKVFTARFAGFVRYNIGGGWSCEGPECEMGIGLNYYISRTQNSKVMLKQNRVIHVPRDLGENKQAISIPNNCKLEAIGFVEDGKLKLSPLLYDALDETNKAAFWIHEGIYSMQRERDAQMEQEGTTYIRKFVASLFASNVSLEELTMNYRPMGIAHIGGTDYNGPEHWSSSIPVVESSKVGRIVFIPSWRERENFDFKNKSAIEKALKTVLDSITCDTQPPGNRYSKSANEYSNPMAGEDSAKYPYIKGYLAGRENIHAYINLDKAFPYVGWTHWKSNKEGQLLFSPKCAQALTTFEFKNADGALVLHYAPNTPEGRDGPHGQGKTVLLGRIKGSGAVRIDFLKDNLDRWAFGMGATFDEIQKKSAYPYTAR